MQSEQRSGPLVATVAAMPAWRRRPVVEVFCGVLPACGLLAELATGALDSVLPLFPSWWHVGFVVLAIGVNLALHRGAWRAPRWLLLRTVALGGTLGMALLYALAQAPAVPAMLLLSCTGLGLLAAAPYFVCLGVLLRLLPDLRARWRAVGASDVVRARLAVLVLALALLPTGLELLAAWRLRALARDLEALAAATRDPAQAPASEALAAAVRAGHLGRQRELCAVGRSDDEHPWGWFACGPRGNGPLAHLGDGRPFWFVAALAPSQCDAASARLAFHRAHGRGWNDGDPAIDALEWRGGADLEWRRSRWTIAPEPDAALARVDWEIEVCSHGFMAAEARFDVRLPPGAVASSLTLWLDGEKRPAAFGPRRVVQAAYDAVVQRRRDPALLQEVAPGLVRLQLFPLSRALPPMRVRVGCTVPASRREQRTELLLPRVVEHNCGRGRMARHEVVFEGANAPAPGAMDDAELAQPLRLRTGAPSAVARDADGWVLQRLVPRAARAHAGPLVVVLDCSASVGDMLDSPGSWLRRLPPATRVVVWCAHGSGVRRCEGTSGSVELARALAVQPFTGGVDARSALQHACTEAAALGVGAVLWLHGAAAADDGSAWPHPTAAVEVAALAVHPGRNVVRGRAPAAWRIVDVPASGDVAAAVAEFVRFGTPRAGDPGGDHERRCERVASPPAAAPVVSDQLARLWAAREARALALAERGDAAAALAARYRLATAGVGAVVLEQRAQYDDHGLDPGAALGREPAGPIGGQPVPEPSTLLLLGSGLAALLWWRRRAR